MADLIVAGHEFVRVVADVGAAMTRFKSRDLFENHKEQRITVAQTIAGG